MRIPKEILESDIKLIIYKDKLMKVSMEDDTHYFGYNIFTDEFIAIKKQYSAIEVPEAVVNLVVNESARVKFANCVTKLSRDAAKLLNISDRTYHRYNMKNSEYSLHLRQYKSKKQLKKVNQ